MRKLIFLFLVGSLTVTGAYAQGKFSGYVFGDYFYNIARDTSFANASLPNAALQGTRSMQAFQIRRIYFAYDNEISEHFMSRFRLEADQVANTTDGKIGVAVKDAFLKWKNIFSGSDLIFGLQPTTAFEISEGAWGARYLEKTIMDLRGIIPSRDLGVALRGKFDDEGVYNYWVMISNGNGQRPAADKYKRYSLTFHIRPASRLQFTLTGDYRDKGDITDPSSTSIPKSTVSNGVLTEAVFAGYANPESYSVGVEAFMQTTFHGFADPVSASLQNRNAVGISVFASANLRSDLIAIGRYDFFDPNTNTNAKGDSRNYFMGGLTYKPDKNVSITPNILVETYEASPNGRTYAASVTGRLTLYYIFL